MFFVLQVLLKIKWHDCYSHSSTFRVRDSLHGEYRDPNMLQCVYGPNTGMDDGVIYLYLSASLVADSPGDWQMCFLLLSQPLNPLQQGFWRGHEWMDSCLHGPSTNSPMGHWIWGCLTVPLHPLYLTYTSSCHLQKFSDYSAVVGCVSEGKELECRYRSVNHEPLTSGEGDDLAHRWTSGTLRWWTFWSTWVFTSTVNWTGPTTLTQCTKVASAFWGGWGPWECARPHKYLSQCSECAIIC